ncbi:MAG: ATP-binding protein [Polyangiaceae bacterium]|nr:ATP-binding protein [Polyangiaceae bacterium]
MKLQISTDLALPAEAITECTAIVGKRGMGKTSTAVVLAEEIVGAGHCLAWLDPLGVAWGLRHAGAGEGYPILILGGDHADAPLESNAGRFVAEVLVETRRSMVLDLSRFSKTQQRTFVADFLEEVYRLNRDPLHLVLDEADTFAPQSAEAGDRRMLGAADACWRRGRARGIGGTLITQRPAVLSKNLLTQSELLITHRLVAPQDRKAISDWVESNSTDPDKGKLMIQQLPSLEVGEAWVWSPGWLDVWKRVKVRQRRTFDSSCTPKVGERRAAPGKAAEIDLEAFRARMAELATTEAPAPKGKANEETVALRARVAELEKKLAERPPAAPALTPEQGDLLRAIRDGVEKATSVLEKADQAAGEILDSLYVARMRAEATTTPAPATTYKRTQQRAKAEASRPAAKSGNWGPGELATLTACAQHTSGCSREQLTILTGYKRSTRDAYIQRLRAAALIEAVGSRFVATKAGVNELGPSFKPLPTGAALRKHWLEQLPPGERALFEQLLAAYPKPIARDRLGEAAGYARSSRDAYLQRLGARGLVTTQKGAVCASEELFRG